MSGGHTQHRIDYAETPSTCAVCAKELAAGAMIEVRGSQAAHVRCALMKRRKVIK